MSKSGEGQTKPEARKRKPLFGQPPMTDEYQVDANDTLYGIAVTYGCTTTELRRLNRLHTSLIFPGQVLYVPSRGDSCSQSQSPKTIPAAPAAESAYEQSVPRPEAARPTIDPHSTVELAGEALADDGDEPIVAQADPQKIIKCRFVTNNGEGIVPGELSVSAYRVSFSPDLDNRLVADRGSGRYSVYVAAADIASMGVYNNPAQMDITDEPTPVGSLEDGGVFLFCSAAQWSKCKSGSPGVPVQACLSQSATSVPDADIEVARSALDSPLLSSSPLQTSRTDMNSAETSTEAAFTVNEKTTNDIVRAQPVSEPVTIGDASSGKGGKPLKLDTTGQNLPRYLCVRTEPLLPIFATSDKKKPEYWFALPLHEVTPLFEFVKNQTTILQAIKHKQLTEVLGSYVLINSFTISEKGTPPVIVSGKQNMESAESVVVTEPVSTNAAATSATSTADSSWTDRSAMLQRRFSYEMPSMLDQSQILSADHLCKLARHLPNSVVGCSWQLAYGTNVHGISLRTMYRKMQNMDGPIMLVVEDDCKHIFGVMSSTQFRISEKFIGTGQCFLFTFHDSISLKIFTWTGDNEFFVKGDPNALCFGSGDGAFGLWLDENLYRGSSHPCKTYDNEILANQEQFIIHSVEAFSFV